MSRFFTDRLAALTPYVPGEQPQDRKYLKLNTNESPFPPAPGVARAADEEAGKAQLYSDPESAALRRALGERYGLEPERIAVSNGSDEVLNYAFIAFGDENAPLIFPDITYGFYPVFAELNRIPYRTVPLDGDFRIRPEDYYDSGSTVVLANPNAPTGIALEPEEIEGILRHNRDHVVLVDEAYVDFGGRSALPLLEKYDNLLIVQTFSKSRSMAGMRIGFAIGSEDLIRAMSDVRYSINSYTMNRTALAAGKAAVEDEDYFRETVKRVVKTRENAAKRLRELGFHFCEPCANFIFAEHSHVPAEELFEALRGSDIYVRHFKDERIRNYLRITIGTDEEMEELFRFLEGYLRGADST